MENKNININEKFCTRCGKKFMPVGREVICPACREAAAEATKKAAVLRAKRASWNGESVPVRISGRASTLIRAYGKHNNLSFTESLDELLKMTNFFENLDIKWEEVKPYKSQRRDKHATQDVSQEVKPQGVNQAVNDEQEVKTAANEVKTAAKESKAVKTTGEASGKVTSKK